MRGSIGLWLGDVWVRAALLHPVIAVGPLVALAFAVADPSDNGVPGPLAFCFYALPVAALASFLVTVVMALRRPLPLVRRLCLVGLGLLASATALGLGLFAWANAAEIACNGGYECPF